MKEPDRLAPERLPWLLKKYQARDKNGLAFAMLAESESVMADALRDQLLKKKIDDLDKLIRCLDRDLHPKETTRKESKKHDPIANSILYSDIEVEKEKLGISDEKAAHNLYESPSYQHRFASSEIMANRKFQLHSEVDGSQKSVNASHLKLSAVLKAARDSRGAARAVFRLYCGDLRTATAALQLLRLSRKVDRFDLSSAEGQESLLLEVSRLMESDHPVAVILMSVFLDEHALWIIAGQYFKRLRNSSISIEFLSGERLLIKGVDIERRVYDALLTDGFFGGKRKQKRIMNFKMANHNTGRVQRCT